MKAVKSTISLILVICVIALSGCQKKASEEIDFGTVEDSVYRNNYFGMSVTFPRDWNVLDRKQIEMFIKMGKNIAAGSDKNLKAVMEASEMQTVSLFAVSKHAIGTPVPFNPMIMCAAERVRYIPGVKRGKDYLFHSRKMIEATQMSVKFPGEIYSETIDNVEFDVMYSEIALGKMNLVIKQKQYAAIKKDYALVFVITFTQDDDEALLEDILDSLKFGL